MRNMATEPGSLARKTILIVDDHPMLCRGLTALIESKPGLAVCGAVATCAAALEAIRKHAPDLVIADLSLEMSDGMDLVKQIQALHPEIPTLVLSMHDEAVYAERALRAGARGYVTKQQLDDTVLAAIQRVLGGEMYLSDKLKARLAAAYLGARTLVADSPLQALSDRELQVTQMLGQGLSTRKIAAALHLSIKTIESHREHIKQKLRLNSATELARFAIRWVETGRTD